MSSRQSARLADKPRHSSNEKVLSSNRTSDSDLLAHHREKTSLPQYSDIDESHGEGSRSKRPRQTKKRRIESKVPEQPDAASLKITGVPRKIRKHANMKWEEPIRAQELLHHSGNQDDSIDLNEPPNTPIWTDFGLKERSRPSELNNASESRDSASSYASYRRKESLECLKFVNHVLIEHFRSEHSTDCVVPSSQLHERDEALLFVDSKDRQSPESPCEERRTEHTDAAQNSSDFEDVPLPDIDFEAFDWDIEPEEEVAAYRGNSGEITLAEMPGTQNGDRASSSSTTGRGYLTAEERVQAVPSPESSMVSEARGDAAKPVREIDESKLDCKRRQLDEQLAEFQRQEAAKADLLTLTEGVDSSDDDDDLAELLSRLKPRAKAAVVRRELRQRHPVQAKSNTTPVAVPKSKEIEALKKVEAKERIRAQAMEYSRLNDQGDTMPASEQSFEPSRDGFAPRLEGEFQDLRDLLGAHVSRHTDVHLSIWQQWSGADDHQGPITEICQAIFGRVSTQQLEGKSFADWQDEIYRCADDLCAGRAGAESLVIPLLGASYDLPLYGLELVRRAVRPALSSLDPSGQRDILQHLADLMDEQDTEHFDAHVFGMLDNHRPFLSWLSLKLLHPGLELSKVDLSTEPSADLLLSLMETEQIALNREASLSQMGDDYLSLRRQSRQLASHWHDLSILFQGYPTTTTRRQSLKDWLSRAEVVLSELLRWMATRTDESFNPKRAQVRETLSLLQSRIQRQIGDLLTNRRADISGGPVEIEDLLKSSLKYHPPEDFSETNTISRQKPQPKLRAKQKI